MWTFRVIYYIATEKKDTCMWVTIHLSVFYVLYCTLLSFMKHINLLRIKWKKLHAFKIGTQSIAAAVLWAACLGSVAIAVSTTTAYQQFPPLLHGCACNQSVYAPSCPRPFASAPPLPGIILWSLELATRHVVSSSIASPGKPSVRPIYSGTVTLVSLPCFPFHTSCHPSVRTAFLELVWLYSWALMFPWPISAVSQDTSLRQGPLWLWENVTPKYYFAVVPKHRKHCKPERSQLPSLPAEMDDSCFFAYPSPGLTPFFFNLFWPPHDMGSSFPVCVCMCVHSVAQACLTLCDPMDWSPPGSSVHGILQARIRERVAFPSPGDLLKPRIKPRSPALRAESLSLSHLGSLLVPWPGIKPTHLSWKCELLTAGLPAKSLFFTPR